VDEELRKEAIRRDLVEGESPKAVYTSINRSKKWFFKWLKRYQSGAMDWYKEYSRATHIRPTAISRQEHEIMRVLGTVYSIQKAANRPPLLFQFTFPPNTTSPYRYHAVPDNHAEPVGADAT
jgi:hypothetical protein